MAVVSDGSRVCDGNRVALQAIDVSHTLTAKSDNIIYCVGVDFTATEQWVQETNDGTRHLAFRTPPGSGGWTNITDTTEVRIEQTAADTVLVDNTIVTDANKRTTKTAPAEDRLRECEVDTAFNHATDADSATGVSAEGQIALDFNNAQDGVTYEFRGEFQHTEDQTALIVYAAQITTPALPVEFVHKRFEHMPAPNPLLRR